MIGMGGMIGARMRLRGCGGRMDVVGGGDGWLFPFEMGGSMLVSGMFFGG
jgi:hypothetical protein